MPKRGAKTLPSEVERRLAEATETIRGVLWKLADGALDHEAVPAGFSNVLRPAVDAARQAGVEARTSRSNVEGRDVDMDMVVATNIRHRRREAEMTQEELAAAMRDRGFDWKRITVAEVEAGAEKGPNDEKRGRRVSYDELLNLAVLFDIPMALLLLPQRGDYLGWGTQNFMKPDEARIGIIGQAILEGSKR